jgi:Zn-dependent peptidase ImmA (M78 family)
LEEHGVVVIRLPLSTASVDAFSLPFADNPVVVLGADKDDRARSRFDGAHELGHLVLHGEQIWGLKEVEDQARMFAAAFLMPADEIRDQLPTAVDWARLFELKRKWQVSLAALLRRARDLGRMTPATYLTAVKAASARGWRRVEPVPLGSPERP